MNGRYLVHIDFDQIKSEIDKVPGVDNVLADKLKCFLDSLKETAGNIEPAMKRETHEDERELWKEYQQLQQEKLAVLDLSHEWDNIEQIIKGINPKLDILIREAIEELHDHVGVVAETHRAHIDILEIYNTRKIEVAALIITFVISYLAVWEFFVRDLLVSIVFPAGLSPSLNYLLVPITLLPVFIAVSWAWIRRKNIF